MRSWLTRRWYGPAPAPWYLRPLSWLFGLVARIRRARQQSSAKRARLPVPVIVVGNIAVGGTGKTPFVIWLVERLRQWGWRPGVISRGYGGGSKQWPQRVDPGSDPGMVGDEPVLVAARTRCPVVVGPDRLAAGALLLAGGDVDIVVSDDGLQHYRLWRDLEIAVVDATRGLGNGRLLPAGPLREKPARLGEVALVIVNGPGWTTPAGRQVTMRLTAREAQALDGGERKPIAVFGGTTVHAVAGIGNPARFFAMLTQQNIGLVLHPFPDHHPFARADLEFGDSVPVLMTEKDAVKCRHFGMPDQWVVPVEALIEPAGVALVQELTNALRKPA
ncbi:MAG: tetraacyldisaccharide 4'-kinase [Gammaproteobacteria bacterium]